MKLLFLYYAWTAGAYGPSKWTIVDVVAMKADMIRISTTNVYLVTAGPRYRE
jgi:hypothetical protein